MVKKKKKREKKLSRWVWIGGAALAGVFFLYLMLKKPPTPTKKKSVKETPASAQMLYYKDFGVDIPVNFVLYGIDISRYQEKVDWKLIKGIKSDPFQIDFAVIKATEGTDILDPFFYANWEAVKKHQLVRGAYLYFIPFENGAAQAQQFIDKVYLEIGDLPPIVDIEKLHNTNPDTMRKRLKECIDLLEATYHTKPIIYSYASFYMDYLHKDFMEYPLWVAHYDEKDRPGITNKSWVFWQFSEKGKLPGIKGFVDLNVFSGSVKDFEQLLLKKE